MYSYSKIPKTNLCSKSQLFIKAKGKLFFENSRTLEKRVSKDLNIEIDNLK